MSTFSFCPTWSFLCVLIPGISLCVQISLSYYGTRWAQPSFIWVDHLFNFFISFYFFKLFFFFNLANFLNYLLNLFQYVLFVYLLYANFWTIVFTLLVFWLWVMWDLSSPPRNWVHTTYIGTSSFNHWTAREVLWSPCFKARSPNSNILRSCVLGSSMNFEGLHATQPITKYNYF